MRRSLTTACVTLAFAATLPAATVSVEVVTTGRVQPTAHREWVQLLAKAGATNARVRAGRAGDRPALNTLGDDSYQVVGVLSSSGRLTLPGGAFTRRDVVRLRDYFERLKADGPERQSTPIGNFGLTREEFEQVFRDLGGPTLFPTAGLTIDQLIAEAGKSLRFEIAYAPETRRQPNRAPTPTTEPTKVSDDLSSLTIGATLAIALRSEGLLLVPEKPRGAPLRYRITQSPKNPRAKPIESWPVGYKPEVRPREVAPAIMEFTNVEIDGYTLAEVIDVIGPRLKIPVLWDHASLARHGIDPAKIDVSLPRSRTFYKKILDKLLFQGRLKGRLRVDEAGTAFYWISREK